MKFDIIKTLYRSLTLYDKLLCANLNQNKYGLLAPISIGDLKYNFVGFSFSYHVAKSLEKTVYKKVHYV